MESLKQLKQEIVSAIVGEPELSVQRVFVFGSRARGTQRNPHADIDIGIEARAPLSMIQLSHIRERIEDLRTLLKIDIVDFTDRNDDFSAEALKEVEVLYEG